MVETVANEDVGELRNLSGKSSPQDIFKATCRLHGIDEKQFKQIASLMEDYTMDFESATQAARAQLNP